MIEIIEIVLLILAAICILAMGVLGAAWFRDKERYRAALKQIADVPIDGIPSVDECHLAVATTILQDRMITHMRRTALRALDGKETDNGQG